MLTYESLRRFVYDEKNTNTLVSLPEDFFEQVITYLEGKKKFTKEDKWELDSAKRFLQDLLEIRERKLLIAASLYVRSGVQPEDITSGEKIFFDRIVQNLKDFQKAKKWVVEQKGMEILEDVPEFVAPDMKTYGPLKKGETVSLPEGVTKLFLEKGLARIRE